MFLVPLTTAILLLAHNSPKPSSGASIRLFNTPPPTMALLSLCMRKCLHYAVKYAFSKVF